MLTRRLNENRATAGRPYEEIPGQAWDDDMRVARNDGAKGCRGDGMNVYGRHFAAYGRLDTVGRRGL